MLPAMIELRMVPEPPRLIPPPLLPVLSEMMHWLMTTLSLPVRPPAPLVERFLEMYASLRAPVSARWSWPPAPSDTRPSSVPPPPPR